MYEEEQEQTVPISPPPTAEQTVVVCGTAGGVGTSVISALLAEYRAATTLGGASWWIDAAGNDGDLHQRLRATGDPVLLRSTLGAGLWPLPEEATVTDAILNAWRFGAVPVVDAGARPLTILDDLCEPEMSVVTPILVVGPRPDLLNRAREIFTEWERTGVLRRAIVVICNQIPGLDHQGLTGLLTDVVSGQVAGVVGMDYEPVLGEGTALDREAQERFAPHTWEVLQALVTHTTAARPQSPAAQQ
ncbi:hypothetical protein [Gordonia rhizosphera]|uniref:CobQ/CobB/MinD/ParA nucleotide binding domain-containing protein n=1 Tax=Gordonia rhizosphera NBRC 16068 TaxID=1108045 RepID=K6VRG4_9ACTN|nr:hypothetical protein [Gordonia rhizosphera]GAB89510.1 hypothetical protein GORHZ_063_00040 [Gordonia rhizosphera NBRC 16068]